VAKIYQKKSTTKKELPLEKPQSPLNYFHWFVLIIIRVMTGHRHQWVLYKEGEGGEDQKGLTSLRRTSAKIKLFTHTAIQR
jgi:hypothetical protein